MPNLPSEPFDDGSRDRLESWKDIAAYLKRDVSTVQRWERREDMPVHRHVHTKAGSVYAFRGELDTWLASRKLQLDELSEPPVGDAVAPSGTATGFSFVPYTPTALRGALERALDAYRHQPELWARLARTGMQQDWSWEHSAAEYEKLYERLKGA